MKVAPASFEQGRTVWHVEREPDDGPLPQRTIWIDGYVRRLSTGIETVWLAMTLAGFAAKRIVVPGGAAVALLQKLSDLLGMTVEGSGEVREHAGERLYGATLVRDSMDHSVACLMGNTAHFSIAVPADVGRTDRTAPSIHIGSNAGFLRRFHDPLDRCGDVATLLMLGPTLALQRVTALVCSEECGAIGPDAMAGIADEVGLALELPFARKSVQTLPGVLMALGVPPEISFQALWERYRMFPSIMGTIYLALRSSLGDDGGETEARRVCRIMTQVASPAAPTAATRHQYPGSPA
jgi:hypothetical protein